MVITSPKNSKIKGLLKLQQKSRERKQLGWFVVEGLQENRIALGNDFEAVQFFVQSDIFDDSLELSAREKYFVSQEVFDRIAYRSTTGGIIGVYKAKHHSLEYLKAKNNMSLVVLEAVEKPGNLGAILRSCDAAHIDAVVVCDPKVDFYNPNVIRSSVGTVFTNQLIACSKEELVSFCKNNDVQILATYLRDDTQDLYDQNLQKSTALIFGTEATGLSDYWGEVADKAIKIPMQGQVDSLNVSNAVAICIYECLRQRRDVSN